MGELAFLAMLAAAALTIAAATRLTPSGGRRAFLREAALVIGAYFFYFLVRGATEGDVATALRNAEAITSFERAIGIFVEPDIQARFLDRTWLVDLANWVYVWGHWPVIGAVAIWLYTSNPKRYRVYRNAFLVSGAIGLVLFMSFPTAPPRLADPAFIDTVTRNSDFYRVLQPPPLTNQYAAFPSLHFGWDLLIGIALVHESSRAVMRAAGVVLPLAMIVAVVATANHYIIDTIAGGALALFGLWVATKLARSRSRHAHRHELRLPG